MEPELKWLVLHSYRRPLFVSEPPPPSLRHRATLLGGMTFPMLNVLDGPTGFGG